MYVDIALNKRHIGHLAQQRIGFLAITITSLNKSMKMQLCKYAKKKKSKYHYHS